MNDDIVRIDDPPDDEVAQLLRSALRDEANEVPVGDRFGDVLDRIEQLETDQSSAVRGGRLRWLSVAAALALALGVAVPLIIGQLRGDDTPPATATPTASTAPVTQGTSGQASLPTTQRRLPIYYTGADGLLYREFRDLPTQSDRLTTSIAAVLNVAPLDPSYGSAWGGGQVNSATLVGNRIVLDLSQSAFVAWKDSASAHRAVQQVVYTAIAAVGDRDGAKTVQILIDGSPQLPVLGRPEKDFARESLRPLGTLWVTFPEYGQSLPTGTVVMSGYLQQSLGDPKVTYRIVREGDEAVIADGTVTASGNDGGWWVWQFTATLTAGQYRLELTPAKAARPVVKNFRITG